ncbi:MAG: tetratricopeptide repeat protein [Bacteroidetes bacterium]|nr:tetratricopeptide repeat protein [Bacteroidota bacterium]
MRKIYNFIISAMILSLITMGFQCGSADFTGAKLHIQQKNYDKAIELLVKETTNNPKNEEAWYLLGRLRAEKGDIDGMNEAFERALAISNTHQNEIYLTRLSFWGQYLNIGFSYLKKASKDSIEYYRLAIDNITKAVKAKPDTGLTYDYLAMAYYEKGEIDSAIYAYTKGWEVSGDLEMYKQVGKIYYNKGVEKETVFEKENSEQIKAFKALKEVKAGAYKSDILRSLGEPDATRKDKKNKKIEELIYAGYNLTITVEGEKVIKTVFSKPYVPKIDSTKYYEALVEYSKAIEVFETVKNKNPHDNENLTLLLQVYVKANRIKEATVAFQDAVKNDPANKTNRYILGVLYRSLGDYTNALVEYKEALRLDPEFTDAAYEIGATLYNWGVDILKKAQEKGEDSQEYKEKFKEALPYLESVVAKRPEDWRIWQTLGTIYARLGDTEKAMKALDKVEELQKKREIAQ